MSNPTLTIKYVANYLMVNERIIYRLAASSELPSFKVCKLAQAHDLLPPKLVSGELTV